MILVDVNVLVYACRRDAEHHREYRAWLSEALGGEEAVGIADESLAAVVRIVTHRKLWVSPLSLDDAFSFVESVRDAPASQRILPGPDHWELFSGLTRDADARGNFVSDAWLAALAMEQGSTLVTTDRDFKRFAGLRSRHPLSSP